MSKFWNEAHRPQLHRSQRSHSNNEKSASLLWCYKYGVLGLFPLMMIVFGIELFFWRQNLTPALDHVHKLNKVPSPRQERQERAEYNARKKELENEPPKRHLKQMKTNAESKQATTEKTTDKTTDKTDKATAKKKKTNNKPKKGNINRFHKHTKDTVPQFTIVQKWIDHFQTLPPFPKVVHLIWSDKHILNSNYEIIEHGAKNLQRLNPDWTFKVHDFDDVRNRIRNFQHPDIPPEYLADLPNAHIVEQSDAFRVLLIYEEGGIYADIDRVMNRNLTETLSELSEFRDMSKIKFVAPTAFDFYIAQDLYGSSPKNELFLNIFKKQCEARQTMERRNGWINTSDEYKLLMLHADTMEEDLFGRDMEYDDFWVWEKARDLMANHSQGTIVTVRDTKCEGLLVKNYSGCSRVKRDSLYEAFNVTKWQKDMDRNWNPELYERRVRQRNRNGNRTGAFEFGEIGEEGMRDLMSWKKREKRFMKWREGGMKEEDEEDDDADDDEEEEEEEKTAEE